MSETISLPFTFVKDGVFYFSRRIPKELKNHYTSPRMTYSLKWSRKTGQSSKVYPKPLKGYENGEAPEFYRPV